MSFASAIASRLWRTVLQIAFLLAAVLGVSLGVARDGTLGVSIALVSAMAFISLKLALVSIVQGRETLRGCELRTGSLVAATEERLVDRVAADAEKRDLQTDRVVLALEAVSERIEAVSGRLEATESAVRRSAEEIQNTANEVARIEAQLPPQSEVASIVVREAGAVGAQLAVLKGRLIELDERVQRLGDGGERR